ncbi:ABC-2 type transport system ATP-binding protein [Dethiosulfatibacter aminovorans DSM 17477]|uniref:ABC-2 type transport system ATP-binding protein n=1 Tax=Dethiosulfatibacter aminovorans DSM 17477 TaxID=1121476 RepID=A0A1M6I1L5_9FIRM|nr:ABC transporter ATP-binding protein [Dethiosulfatibacter aminovorans]SHJ28270.1 ABC-2 type transport system ATP-binding protein [Dethiosulfatibacter aminovorans DSM 17477]
MYSFCNISKHFKNEKVLKDISINMNEGEIYGFLGCNGAGKTTTMNILSGLASYDSGICLWNGRNIELERIPLEIPLGYMMEEPIFYNWMTGFENLSLYSSKPPEKNTILRLLDTVGMLKSCNKRVSSYSRGMKQRLGMACALVNNPDFLILDEPTSALDPEGRKDILNLVSDLRDRGKSIILSTHILNDAEAICDKVGIIRNGKTILEDSMENLLDNHLSQIYSIETDISIDENLLYSLIRKKVIKDFRNEGSVSSITLKGNKGINDVLSVLMDNGMRILEVKRIKQSLENIFIERTGDNDETSVA